MSFFSKTSPLIFSIVICLTIRSIENSEYVQTAHYCLDLLIKEPQNINLLCDYAFILQKLGNYQQAQTLYEHALSINQSHPRTHRAYAHALLAQGLWHQGWHEYEWRWIPVPCWVYEVKEYLKQHGTLKGIRLLLKTEYGFGDIFQFIRYAKLFKNLGAYIILECHPKLINILSRCSYLDEIVPTGTETVCHLQAFIMSGPLICNTMPDTVPTPIPYLFAQPELIAYWKEKINYHGLRIGICWQADMQSSDAGVRADAREKSLPIEYLEHLAQLPGIHLYSLQKHLDQESSEFVKSLGITTFGNLDDEHGSFMDTAAIMHHLDLIITIDTSIAHLAAALGKETWTLLSYSADWRWLRERNDTPWYPTMKLFRQSSHGDWESVIEQVSEMLNMQ